jgi:hypothetical protein
MITDTAEVPELSQTQALRLRVIGNWRRGHVNIDTYHSAESYHTVHTVVVLSSAHHGKEATALLPLSCILVCVISAV